MAAARASKKTSRLVGNISANFRESITKTRTKAGQTMKDLGAKCGVSAATIRSVEGGKSSLETMVNVLHGQGRTSKEIARMVSKAGS